MLVSLAITLALSVAGVLAMQVVSNTAQKTQQLANHTLDVIASAEHLGRLGFDAQAAMRGYLLLGDQGLSRRFAERSSTFDAAASALADLVVDNPAQAQRVQEIRELHRGWERIVQPVVSRYPTITDEDRRVVRAGAVEMDRLTEMLATFTRTERLLLGQRRSASASAASWMTAAAIVVIALAVLVACITAFSLALRVARDAERLATAASAIASGDLSRRVEVGAKDELAAVGNAFNQMAERLARSSQDEESLARLREMLQASQTSSEAHGVLERLGPQCLPVPAARLYVVDASRQLTPTVAWGDDARLPPGEEFAAEQCWALRSGRPHVARDSRDVTCPHREGTAGGSVCLPLVAQGESVGMLYLAHDEVPPLAHDVAEMIGPTLANLRLRDVLRDQAIRDPLTGLFNRRYLEETLQREIARVRRKKASLAVIVLDVDHFKRFNDTYGHQGGDVMLCEFANVLTKSFRDSDIICRFGGEEFVVVAPECSLDVALARTEEMRGRLRAVTVTLDGKQVPGPTVSAGIAMYPDHGAVPDMLFQAADRAVYKSKSDGRDRVTVAT